MAYGAWASDLGSRADAALAEAWKGASPIAIVSFANFKTNLLTGPARHAAALEAMTTAVTDGGDLPCGARYLEALKGGAEQVARGLGSALDGIDDPPLPLLALRDIALKEARVFWDGLAAIDAGAVRDQLIGYVAKMNAKMGELSKHFDTLSESARAAIKQENDLAQQMYKEIGDALAAQTSLFDRVAYRIDEKIPFLKDPAKSIRKTGAEIVAAVLSITIWSEKAELWKNFADQMSKPGAGYFKTGKELGIPAGELARAAPELQRDIGMYVSDTFQDFVKGKLGAEYGVVLSALGIVADQIESSAERYRQFRDGFLSVLPNHGTILVLMTNTRQQTDAFIRDNSYDDARRTFDAAQTALASWRDSQSGGIKTDAGDFANAAVGALGARGTAAQGAYRKFIDDNQSMFLGTISGRAEEALWNPQLVLDASGRIRSLGYDERLRAWRDRAIAINPELDSYQDQVMAAVATLPEDVQDDVRAAVQATFEPVRRAAAERVARLRQAIEKAQAIEGADQAARDLDIKAVRDNLR